MVRKSNLLATVFQEESTRRKTTISEVYQLLGVVQKWYKANVGILSVSAIKFQTLKALDYDVAMMSKFNEYLSSHPKVKNVATNALKYNKNLELFNCAKSKINEDFDRMINNNLWEKYPVDLETTTVLGGVKGDFKGTSFLNCLQTGLFSILYANKGVHNITYIEEFAQNNIYNVNHSPVVQTTKLPTNFEHTDVDTHFKEWIYYYADSYSPSQGELLFFTLGYSFGGSREDKRYAHKELRAEDCSSAVAKWINAPFPFATIHMEELFDRDCRTKECKAIVSILTPVSEQLNSVQAGDIFAFRTYDLKKDPHKQFKTNAKGGHTGVITKLYPQEDCFESLSYAREVPDIEGLGLSKYCIKNHPARKYMFFSLNESEAYNLHKPDHSSIADEL